MAGFYNIVEEEYFKLPDMGEYYDEELVEQFLEEIDSANPDKVAFYMEEPFTTKLGYDSEYDAFVIKAEAQITHKNDVLNATDGDTMIFSIDSIEDGDVSFTANGKEYKNFKSYFRSMSKADTYLTNSFSIRTVGIDAPEITHYSVIPYDSDNNIKEMTLSQAKNNGVVYDKSLVREDDEKISCISTDENKKKYYEVVERYSQYPFDSYLSPEDIFNEIYYNDSVVSSSETSTKEVEYLKIVTSSAQEKDTDTEYGMLAKTELINLIKDAEDIRIVIDNRQLSNAGLANGPYKSSYDVSSISSLSGYIKNLWLKIFGENVYKWLGWNAFGQDKYNRWLGSIYIKTKPLGASESMWINAAKYIISKLDKNLTIYTDNSELSQAFKLWTYDPDKIEYVDGFLNLSSKDLDDRRELQKQIVGFDYDIYKDYTVMIGDCLFMIPPTSIRLINQSQSNRVQLLRSKGSMVKELPSNEKLLQLTLYFNNEANINGYEIKKELPNGEEITYHMNGLRALIAMFKVTPYLPIENDYINNTLNIEAVSLQNIQIQTMPMYPKCLAVSLTLQQFNYRVYMNDLPVPDPEKNESYSKNMFASTINYGVMRYYYQKLIRNGEELKYLNTLSNEYIHNTLGSKTSLLPMTFKDQKIKFYKLDSNWLDKLLAIKEEAAKKPINQTSPLSEDVSNWANQVGISLGYILEKISDIAFPLDIKSKEYEEGMKIINELGDQITASQQCPLFLGITYSEFDDKLCLAIKFDLNNITTKEFSNLLEIIYKELALDESAEYKEFVDGVLRITFEENSNKNYIDKNSQSYKIAEFFAFRSGAIGSTEDVDNGDWEDFIQNSMEDYLETTKDSIDLETILSAKFVEYPLDILVQQASVSMGNTFANVKLKAYDGPSPQYCGGQDTVIEFVFYTQKEEDVNLITILQEIAAQDLIKYRKIISCWPIRIDCELTKLCGINEVLIESLDINTVPGQPGLFAINCRMLSVDRTMRNREALTKLDAINNAGATNQSGTMTKVYKTYFELNKTLSKTEVYPDLELPSIEELEKIGYRFIKYNKSKNNRIYPDPDFYFVYGYVYSSQMIRKLIIDYFKDNGNGGFASSEFEYSDDSSGQTAIVSLGGDKVTKKLLNFEFKNETLRDKYFAEEEEKNKEISNVKKKTTEEEKEIKKMINDTNEAYEAFTKYENDILNNTPLYWNVCENVKCILGDVTYRNSKESDVCKELEEKTSEIIALIDSALKQPIKEIVWAYYKTDNIAGVLKEDIGSFYEDVFKDENSVWLQLFKILKVDKPKKKMIEGIYLAAAMACSGGNEYSEEGDELSFAPKAFVKNSGISEYLDDAEKELLPYSFIIDENTTQTFLASSIDQAVKQGITFGAYQIKKYSKSFLKDFYGDEKKYKDFDFIDPYYNKTLHKELIGSEISEEELETHIKNLIESPMYNIYAFDRVVLVWLKRLLEDKIYLSFFDLKRDTISEQYSKIIGELKKNNDSWNDTGSYKGNMNYAANAPETYSAQNMYAANSSMPTEEDKDKVTVSSMVDDIANAGEELDKAMSSYEKELVVGKVFLPLICAVMDGNSYVYEDIKSRSFGSLETKTQSCSSDFYVGDNVDIGERTFRKIIRALCWKKVDIASNWSKLATSNPTKLEEALADRTEKLWIAAAEDPSLWIMHSFYDMIVYNKRGRMARAFPTYYMMLIDEGREIGYWQLHDNFYNTSSITEIEVTKSRKIAADTAKVVLTNMYKTFTTDDEDIKTDYYRNAIDVFRSIFNPHLQFTIEEEERNNQSSINRIKLKPGARVQIRMGYSGDASELPIVFNGVIAEVTSGELIEIVAQGDGHELVNPNAFSSTTTKDLADLKNESSVSVAKWIQNFFTEGATPKQLITYMLTTKSSWLQSILNKMTDGRLFNDNMFGIVNFGEIDYKLIHRNGEVVQNIYEAEGKLPWVNEAKTGSLAELHSSAAPPVFTIELEGKSPWDILNICASTCVDFLTSIATFGVRSTIFYGRPHYYYAYDYIIKDDGAIAEKRKPFRQYHLFDSYTDIIANNIIANGRDIRTCAVPIYKGPTFLSGFIDSTKEKVLNPLWVDFDIYPEYQKRITVDTGITYKGTKFSIIGYDKFVDENSEAGGEKIAWRMGARALQDSIKDMYTGELITLGDPIIKPYDRIYIHDIYEKINGTVDVEAVVQRMSPESGFTTSIYADCISTIDDQYEQIGYLWSSKIFKEVLAGKAAIYGLNSLFDTTTKPLLNFIGKTITKGVHNVTKVVNKASQFVSQEDLIKYSKVEKWGNKFYEVAGINSSELQFWTLMDSVDKYKDLFTSVKTVDIKNANEMILAINKTISAIEKTDLNDISKSLLELKNDGKITEKYIDNVNEVITTLTKNGDNIKAETSTIVKSLIDDVVKSASKVDNLTEDGAKALATLKKYSALSDLSIDDAKDAMKAVSKIADKADDIYDNVKLVTAISKYGDDVADIVKVSSKAISGASVKSAFASASLFAGGPVGAVIWFVAETLLEYILVKNVYDWAEMTMASFNVLQIYPLKKDGAVMVAGLDGHKGLVVGSSTYTQEGVVGQFINWVFKDRGWAYNLVKDALFSENMMNIAENYKKDDNIGDESSTTNNTILDMLQSLAEDQASNYSMYQSLSLSKRITNLQNLNAKYTFNKIKVETTGEYKTLASHPIILNDLVPICISNTVLQEYYENGFFKTAHDFRNIKEEYISQIKRVGPVEYETKTCGKVNLYGIALESNNRSIIDIPFLRPDAFQVLYKIITNIATENSVQNPGEKEKQTVWLLSATTVNSNEWSSTGYSFKISITNCNNTEEVIKNIANGFSNSNGVANKIIQYKVRNNDTYEVFVSPRDEYNGTTEE